MKWIDGDLWPQGALPPLIHSCINPSLFRNAEISLRSPAILLLFSTDMCWYYAVECSHLSLCGFVSLVLPYTTNLFVNAIVSVMQRSRVTSAANVSCLITPGWRESGYNRASVRTLALFLKKGMGWDNTTAALLLKGSFCAAPSPTSCLRVVSPVGHWGGGWGVSLVVVQNRLCRSSASFCRWRRERGQGSCWRCQAEVRQFGLELLWGLVELCAQPLWHNTHTTEIIHPLAMPMRSTQEGLLQGKKRGQEPLNSNNTSVQLNCVWMI